MANRKRNRAQCAASSASTTSASSLTQTSDARDSQASASTSFTVPGEQKEMVNSEGSLDDEDSLGGSATIPLASFSSECDSERGSCAIMPCSPTPLYDSYEVYLSGFDAGHSSDNSRGDEPPDEGTFEEFEEGLLASDFAELEGDTLPGSSTTKEATVMMIMAFVITHGLTWAALDDLLKLIDGLFGFKESVLPKSKYLFRKLWCTRMQTVVKHFFYCDACGSLMQEAGTPFMEC
ncbi:hypothetical protein HPB50_007191 [Hyalomma asiaticum]|uniref:Uncharacterized protein n=1 Tax=Hyalomma asiaticum TaxID=266040 RepID=A0ACB7RKP8_HYAAI|nr:hypothetical protein HPB50_007191 [Hyalomma asiaticum]